MITEPKIEDRNEQPRGDSNPGHDARNGTSAATAVGGSVWLVGKQRLEASCTTGESEPK